MRFPAYILLPISGAVVLIAAVLGSWLWPAPTAPTSSFVPPAVPAQAAVEPPPPPEPVRAPPRPAARPVNTRPVQPMEKPVERPMNPVAMQPPPPPPPPPVMMPPPQLPPPMAGGPPPVSQWADMTPEAREAMKARWKGLPSQVGELAWKGVETLERQRDEARARGDQAEAERLEGLIRQGRENLERMKAVRQEPLPTGQAAPPPQ